MKSELVRVKYWVSVDGSDNCGYWKSVRMSRREAEECIRTDYYKSATIISEEEEE